MEVMGCIKPEGKTLIKPISLLHAEQTASLLAGEYFLSRNSNAAFSDGRHYSINVLFSPRPVFNECNNYSFTTLFRFPLVTEASFLNDWPFCVLIFYTTYIHSHKTSNFSPVFTYFCFLPCLSVNTSNAAFVRYLVSLPCL